MESTGNILLGTAKIKITSNFTTKTLRALCDNGSQINLITENAIKEFGIKPLPSKTFFTGIGGNKLGTSMGSVTLQIKMLDETFITAKFHVVKQITTYQPNGANNVWKTLNITLADSQYDTKGVIDDLLGIEVWIQIIQPTIIQAHNSKGIAQKTKIGFVVFEVSEDPYQTQDPSQDWINQ